MEIRTYRTEDIEEIAALFYETVHSVNARDYAPEQLDAWAAGSIDTAQWDSELRSRHALVATEEGQVVGFGDMDENGHLDRLYVHKEFQGRGVATAICDRLESGTRAERITVHASITARPFFEKRGYRTVREQRVERRGVFLTNYVMEKRQRPSREPSTTHKRPAMNLETERLTLRPWRDSDAEELYKYARDGRVGLAAGWPAHQSVEESREIIRTVFAQKGVFAVTLKGDGKAIGCVGLTTGARSNYPIGENEGELSYWIGVPFWGKGLITEAAREVIRYGFEELNLTALWCGHFDGNERSRRVQEKCGFRHQRTEKDRFCELINAIRTEHISRLTRAEWAEAKKR